MRDQMKKTMALLLSVLLLGGLFSGCGKKEEVAEEAKQQWEAMPLEEHVAMYEAKGLPRKDAMKAAAKDRGISKREIYAKLCI